MRRRFPAIFCAAAVLTGLAAGCGAQESALTKMEGALYMETANETGVSGGRRVIYPQESTEILHNPGMGWVLLEEPLYPGRATLGWQGDFPEVDSVSLSLSWGNVEPEDGRYDWSEMDKAIDYWTGLGKRINMRLVTDLNTIGYPLASAPDWVGDKYGVPYSVEPGVGSVGVRLYDLANPTFLQLHDRFVRDFADRYRDNPMVDVVEIRSYGWWGEWHSSGNFKSVEERVATLRHMLDVWQEAWGDKLMVVSASYEYNQQYEPYEVLDTSMTSMDDFAYVSAFDYTVQKGMTFRRDGIGAALHYWDEKLLEDTFKMNNRLPLLGEHFGGYHVFLNKVNGYDLTDFMSEALYKLHSNYMTAIGWVAEGFAEVTAAKEDGGSPEIVDWGNREMGYRLVPHRLEYDTEICPGGTLRLSQLWSNTAAGRAWQKADLTVFLTGADGTEVWRGTDKSFDPVVFTAGDLHWHESGFALPEDLAPGEYDLRLALTDPETGEPWLKLPIANRDEAGRYFLDRIQVKKRGKTEAPEGLLRPEIGGENGLTVLQGQVREDALYAGEEGKRFTGDVLESGFALEKGAYLVRFSYTTEIPAEEIRITSNERYTVALRDAAGETVRQYRWRDVSNEPAERTFLFSVEEGGCKLVWSLEDAFPITLGEVAVQRLPGEWTAEDFQDGNGLTVLANGDETGIVQPEPGVKRFQVSSVGLESEEPRVALARTAALKPNTAYYVSFSTWGGKTSAGNYDFLDLRSGEETRTLSNWFEREDFGAVNKTFHFVTGSEGEQYLEFGCYRSGSFQVDDLLIVEDAAGTAVAAESVPEEQRNQVRRPKFAGYPVTADFEGSSFHSSMLNPGTDYQGRFTWTPGEVISGDGSAFGKAWETRDGWVNFLSTVPRQVPFAAGKTYRVEFAYRILEEAASEEEGFQFRVLDGSGQVALEEVPGGATGEVLTYRVSFTPDSEGWTLQWGLNRSGSVAVDDVVITEK